MWWCTSFHTEEHMELHKLEHMVHRLEHRTRHTLAGRVEDIGAGRPHTDKEGTDGRAAHTWEHMGGRDPHI